MRRRRHFYLGFQYQQALGPGKARLPQQFEVAVDLVQRIAALGVVLAAHNMVGESPRIREIHEFIAAFDVFVLPSYREGLPISLLEAQAQEIEDGKVRLAAARSAAEKTARKAAGFVRHVELDVSGTALAGRFRAVSRDSELRYFLAVALVGTLVLAVVVRDRGPRRPVLSVAAAVLCSVVALVLMPRSAAIAQNVA